MTSTNVSADPVIKYHNAFLGKDFPNVDCATRKTDMCTFGNQIDGNNICKIEDVKASVGGNLARANGLATMANFKHGAVFHKGDCIAQHTYAQIVHIHNAAKTIADPKTPPSSKELFRNDLGKLINGTPGSNDGLIDMVDIAKKDGGRLDDPRGFIATVEPIITNLRQLYEQNNMQGILKAAQSAIQNKTVFQGKCEPISAMKACQAAEQQHLTQ